MSEDLFAMYAQKADTAGEGLYLPEPIPHETIYCDLKPGNFIPISPMENISTEKELNEALAALRKVYAPYLAELAPAAESKRQSIPLLEFLLDGEAVTLPHYSGPACPCVKCYSTEFELSDFDGRAVYFCCGGADYIARIYINGECAGIHEGFFSPFEYEITRWVKPGTNSLRIVLENDYIFRGNDPEQGFLGTPIQGDKLYAATGIGYDDPKLGWHHCPPGMGLYHDAKIEIRNPLHISDVFVRPQPEKNIAEVWIEVENVTYNTTPLTFSLSLYGQNFPKTVFTDSITEPSFKNKPMPAMHGKQVYKLPIDIQDCRLWSPDTPWLYQLQVRLIADSQVCDIAVATFGIRSFIQDCTSQPKGMFYLNGDPIRLRGANTMGFEQLDVMRNDFSQLIDDILLTKLCNMNFWRITQRPVQREVYDYCDKLGLLTQSDFPLFGVMRRNKGCEAIRQVEEMARHIRNHPCNVVVSYINEPWKNANNQPHRHMQHHEREELFAAFDSVMRYNHPDCVIKHVDGDFDPPTANSMPDVHCYTLWYNGAQQDFGMLHRGYGQKVAPGWYYGCGEYGAEGLDFPEVMRKFYPPEWIREPFDPGNIIGAQSKALHGSFMDTPDGMEAWSCATQAHQAFAMKMMTEAYRRDPRMISSAVHLFIDAWPAGWMKAIMDFRRKPKPAYFAVRDAFSPLLISLRSDRFFYYSGEDVRIETYICNDTNEGSSPGETLVFALWDGEKPVSHGSIPANYEACNATYIADAHFTVPASNRRKAYCLRASLLDAGGKPLAQQSFTFSVFPDVDIPESPNTVWIDHLEPGTHIIAGETVTVTKTPRQKPYFLSRKTGHPAVADFTAEDFRMWYDRSLDRLAPLAGHCFRAEGFRPVLICNGDFDPYMVIGEKLYKGKRYIICLADLRLENPPAKYLYRNLLLLEE